SNAWNVSRALVIGARFCCAFHGRKRFRAPGQRVKTAQQQHGEVVMPFFICTACGMQYAESGKPPAQCTICEEERQYGPPRRTAWTTLEALAQGYMNAWREYDSGIIGIGSQPAFAIGQRALLLRTSGGNVLWDCIATLDAATVTAIKGIGGLKAI